MSDVLPSWDSYARLQAELEAASRVSKTSWATEEAMDSFLESFAEGREMSIDDINRATTNTLRRYRYQNRLTLLKSPAPELVEASMDAQLEARDELRALRDSNSPEDFALLIRVGLGFDYAEIAADAGKTTGNLRQRVLRSRQKIMAKAA